MSRKRRDDVLGGVIKLVKQNLSYSVISKRLGLRGRQWVYYYVRQAKIKKLLTFTDK